MFLTLCSSPLISLEGRGLFAYTWLSGRESYCAGDVSWLAKNTGVGGTSELGLTDFVTNCMPSSCIKPSSLLDGEYMECW